MTEFDNPLVLDQNKEFEVGLNRVISMSFTWFNVNPGLKNQLIRFSKDGGKTWTDIAFPARVWDYEGFDEFIKEKSGGTRDSNGKMQGPIELSFNAITFRVTLKLDANYRLDLTKSNFFVTDGKRRLVDLHGADVAYSLILRERKVAS